MKKLFITATIVLSTLSFAQVGINTNSPSTSLDITAKEATGTAATTDGILIPRVTRQRAQSMTGTPTSTMIYINEVITGTQTGTTANVSTPGFYYYNGTAWTKVDSNIYENNGTLTGNRTVTQGASTLAFTGSAANAFSVDGTSLSVDAANHRVGIGTTAPTTALEVASGTAGTSGLKFTNINNATPSTANTSPLGIDASGNVVLQSTLTTSFRSFSIDANTPTNSIITLGTLEFRYPTTTCTSTNTYLQVRSLSGNNTGIVHGITRAAQDGSAFISTAPIVITPTFANVGAGQPVTPNPTLIPVNCVQDGSAQFTYFSYTDRTFYRVSFHVADGDGLVGFGPLGYIFVELQK